MINEKTPQWKVSLFVIFSLLILLTLIIFIFLITTGWQASNLSQEEVTLEKPSIIYTDPLIKSAYPLPPPVEAVDPIRGSDLAEVRIIYLSDFNCPFCKRMSETWARVLDKYGDQVQLVWKDFITNPGSVPFHKAARCAQLQGAFWEYHDRLLTHQPQEGLSNTEFLTAYAVDLGLDRADFLKCLADTRIEEVVYASSDQALNLGISATPTYFINGVFYDGFREFEEIDLIIKEELGITDEE